jgi:hypothetical protein
MVQLYAAQRGLSRRAAQYHRAKGHPEWQRFLSAQGAAALESRGPVERGPVEALVECLKSGQGEAIASSAEMEGKSDAEQDEIRAGRIWRANITAAEHAARTGDATSAMMFARTAADLYKLFLATRRARLQDEMETRSLVPAAEFEEFRGALQEVSGMVRNLDRELAHLANPDAPHVARAAISAWLRDRWNPAITRMITAAAIS